MHLRNRVINALGEQVIIDKMYEELVVVSGRP